MVGQSGLDVNVQVTKTAVQTVGRGIPGKWLAQPVFRDSGLVFVRGGAFALNSSPSGAS